MSRQPLPEHIDPVRLADQGRELEGVIPNSAMRRLAEGPESGQGETLAHLEFGFDAGRRRVLRGWAQSEVSLLCQRCLEHYRQPLRADFALAIVSDEEQAARLPEEYDPLFYGGRPIRTADIVEEELILALPIVPMHARDDAACAGNENVSTETHAGTTKEEAKPNPFAVLEQLRKR